jgi:hypothetical protein
MGTSYKSILTRLAPGPFLNTSRNLPTMTTTHLAPAGPPPKWLMAPEALQRAIAIPSAAPRITRTATAGCIVTASWRRSRGAGVSSETTGRDASFSIPVRRLTVEMCFSNYLAFIIFCQPWEQVYRVIISLPSTTARTQVGKRISGALRSCRGFLKAKSKQSVPIRNTYYELLAWRGVREGGRGNQGAKGGRRFIAMKGQNRGVQVHGGKKKALGSCVTS